MFFYYHVNTIIASLCSIISLLHLFTDFTNKYTVESKQQRELGKLQHSPVGKADTNVLRLPTQWPTVL